MTLSAVEIIHVHDVFGQPVGFRSVVRAVMPSGLSAVGGCVCPGAHSNEYLARNCSVTAEVIKRWSEE